MFYNGVHQKLSRFKRVLPSERFQNDGRVLEVNESESQLAFYEGQSRRELVRGGETKADLSGNQPDVAEIVSLRANRRDVGEHPLRLKVVSVQVRAELVGLGSRSQEGAELQQQLFLQMDDHLLQTHD